MPFRIWPRSLSCFALGLEITIDRTTIVNYRDRRRVSDEGRRTEGASALVAVQLAERHAIQPCTVWLAPGVRMELATLPSPQWLGQLVASMNAQVH